MSGDELVIRWRGIDSDAAVILDDLQRAIDLLEEQDDIDSAVSAVNLDTLRLAVADALGLHEGMGG